MVNEITEWRRTLLMARRDDVIAAPNGGTTYLVAFTSEDHRSTERTLTLVPLAGGEAQVVTVS